jgi:hypothetical protein
VLWVGWSRAQAEGAKSFSWTIVLLSTIVGLLPGGIVFLGASLLAREIIHWGGPYRSMGVIEGLCGLVLGAACAGFVGYQFSLWQHRKRHRWLNRNQL